jgi:hypothetical protein
MKRAKVSALAALLLGGCWVYAEGGYYWDDDCWDDCDDHHHSYTYDGWQPDDVVVEDLNGDGRLDLAVGDGGAEAVWLVLAREIGFDGVPDRQIPTRAVPSMVAPFDALGDGGSGLLVLGAGGLEAFAVDASGELVALPPPFTPESLAGATRFVRARVDGDGFDDLAYVDAAGGVRVALGTGAGTFEEVVGAVPASDFLGPLASERARGLHVVVSTFDRDDEADLVVVDGESAALAVFAGRGDGTFGAPQTATFGSLGDLLSVAALHLEPGGRAHVAMLFGDADDPTATSTLTVVDPENGTLALDSRTVGTARSITAADLDGDGRTDLLVSDPTTGAIRPLYLRKD